MTTEPTGEITTLRRENSMMRQQLLAAGKRNENLTATLRVAGARLQAHDVRVFQKAQFSRVFNGDDAGK